MNDLLAHVNWVYVQKGVEALLIFVWEHWLANTEVVKANSTFQLIGNAVVNLFKSKIKEGDVKNG